MIDRQAIVTLSVKGPYTGKPRPWVVVQSNAFPRTDSIILCPFTRRLIERAGFLRIDVTPSAGNGLRVPSQLQAEKIITVRRADLDGPFGRLEDAYMRQLEQAMRAVLEL